MQVRVPVLQRPQQGQNAEINREDNRADDRKCRIQRALRHDGSLTR